MDGYDAVVEISIMPGRLTTYDEVVRDGAPVRLVGAEREDESLLDLVSGDETVTRARFHLRAGVQIEGADSAMVEEVLVQAWPEESARSWSVIKLAPGDTEYESKQYGSWATARTEPEAMANEGIIQLEPPSVMDERTRVRSLEENLRRRGRPS
ncbi:hypothetical protein [Arthrobacter sp. NPDC090010]|uniref:hypothetical protein n=1 Tax=Arthrobacter sp. NPDC090010 TaxID=3363942 RepID=UPI00381DD4B6